MIESAPVSAGVGVKVSGTWGRSGTASTATSSAEGSGRYVAGPYEWRTLPGIGHFPQEEAPDLVSAAVAEWAAG